MSASILDSLAFTRCNCERIGISDAEREQEWDIESAPGRVRSACLQGLSIGLRYYA